MGSGRLNTGERASTSGGRGELPTLKAFELPNAQQGISDSFVRLRIEDSSQNININLAETFWQESIAC